MQYYLQDPSHCLSSIYLTGYVCVCLVKLTDHKTQMWAKDIRLKSSHCWIKLPSIKVCHICFNEHHPEFIEDLILHSQLLWVDLQASHGLNLHCKCEHGYVPTFVHWIPENKYSQLRKGSDYWAYFKESQVRQRFFPKTLGRPGGEQG